jgi:hypothetical protein
VGLRRSSGSLLAKMGLALGSLGSVKGQLAETLDSRQSFGCRPMTLSGLKSVDQQIRPPLAAPMLPFLPVAALGSFRVNLPKGAWKA